MGTEGSGASRGGSEGFHNEDAFLASEGLGLYVVCDGASQTPAGEIAAGVATRALEEFVRDAQAEQLSNDAIAEQGMYHALHAIDEAESTEPDRDGMSASVTMLLTNGQRGVIGHRGDSRAYLIRRRRAQQLTVDQELTNEIPPTSRGSEIQVFGLDLEPGDTLVLCTDGAEEVVEDASISRIAGDVSPVVLASRIVSAANRRAPAQDATAVVVRVRGGRDHGGLELSGRPAETVFGHTLAPKQQRGGARRKN